MNRTANIIQFKLPDHLSCPEPTEIRNLERDEVRLLVTSGSGHSKHTLFRNLDNYLQEGDVLVVNTSATRPSAVPTILPGNQDGMVHFSTRISDRKWLVEIRKIKGNKTLRWNEGKEGMKFDLPDSAKIRLNRKFYKDRELLHLWVVEFVARKTSTTYLYEHGQPIKYDHLDKLYPLDFYQTIFSRQAGSSEMPSAGRGFTQNLVDRLLAKGVVFAPILLHTGVSSLEDDEPPYPEYMEICEGSAAKVNRAVELGKKIIAVGTTSVRAIESALNESGDVSSFAGNTDLYIRDGYKMKVINGLLTGFHEPNASHLQMLQSLAGIDHLEYAYITAIEKGYFWHQFGDLHLILPDT